MVAIVIAAARRTPIGSLGGALSSLPAHELGALAIKAALADAGLAPDAVEETIMGQVLTGGAGMNPARQAARAAGLSDAAPAMTINQVCGSGLRAVALAAQQIETGMSRIVVAGGQESMSCAPHVALLRPGKKLGDISLVDSVMHDGLSDAFYGYPMGTTAENIAKSRIISREAQDMFALASQQKASAAARRQDDSSPKSCQSLSRAKRPIRWSPRTRRSATTPASTLWPACDRPLSPMAQSPPAIPRASMTAPLRWCCSRKTTRHDATFLHWSASPLGPMSDSTPPSWASVRSPPRSGQLSAPAGRRSTSTFGKSTKPFAAQSLAVIDSLAIDPERININGGAIALGHPIGASGARVLTTLIYELKHRRARRGMATLCIGGGMGIALCVEGLWS